MILTDDLSAYHKPPRRSMRCTVMITSKNVGAAAHTPNTIQMSTHGQLETKITSSDQVATVCTRIAAHYNNNKLELYTRYTKKSCFVYLKSRVSCTIHTRNFRRYKRLHTRFLKLIILYTDWKGE